jgi:hypothetical protein
MSIVDPAQDDARGDAGAITLFVAVMAVALFAAVGLVVDAGGRVHALQVARRTSGEAARAAAEVLDAPSVIAGAQPNPDTARAARAARSFLTAAQARGRVTVTGRTVHVTAETVYEPVFLSIIGLGPMTLTAESEATPTRGTPEERP